jgi:hemoglobin
MSNLFDRCGGFAVVRQIVSSFYDKVLDSPMLERHFAKVDMHRLIDHQTKFMATLMGGPASFTDDALRRAHVSLGITAEEFYEAGELLRESLEEFGLHPADIRQVYDAFIAYAPVVVVDGESETRTEFGG